MNTDRVGIYTQIVALFANTDIKYFYPIEKPISLTANAKKQGFMVIRAGNIDDNSEFSENAYAEMRIQLEMYIPTKSNGIVDGSLFSKYQSLIDTTIKEAVNNEDSGLNIIPDDMLNADDFDNSNADNPFSIYIKSFLILIN